MSDKFPMTIMVSESQFQDAMRAEMESLIKRSVADYVRNWSRNQDVTKTLNKVCAEMLEPLVREELSNVEALKQEIQKQVKRKLESQLRTLLSTRNMSAEDVDDQPTTS